MDELRLIDTHCHLNLPEYREDYHYVATRALDEGIGINNVGCDYASSARAVEIAQEYLAEPVWASIGQHPTDSSEIFDEKKFEELARSSDRVIAIGETGLDYYRLPAGEDNSEEIARQKKTFLAHMELAHKLGLPLIIHCRDAHEDVTALLMHQSGVPAEGVAPKERGVMHCFTGTLQQAQSYIDLGFLISFTGIVTFATQYDEIIAALPLEKILIETDAPFLTPTPNRGKRNEPVYVERVAEKIAEIKGISVGDVAVQTTKNARRLFGV